MTTTKERELIDRHEKDIKTLKEELSELKVKLNKYFKADTVSNKVTKTSKKEQVNDK